MSLTGALNAGVTGLQANSQNLGIISDNIANSQTVGYKEASGAFETLVTVPITRTTYSPGGTLVNPIQLVDKQGLIQASQSTTDLSISGRGFFATAASINPDGTIPIGVESLYTRAGSFKIDKSGNLVNTAGQYLLGNTAVNGIIPTASAPVNQLRAITVGAITGSAKATSNVAIGVNLPASAPVPSGAVAYSAALNVSGTAPYTANTFNLVDATGVPTARTDARFVVTDSAGALLPSYTTAVTVYDSLGVAYNLNLAFVRQPTAAGPTPPNSGTWQVYATGLNVIGASDTTSVPGVSLPIDATTGNGLRTGGAFAAGPLSLGTIDFDQNGLPATTTNLSLPGTGIALQTGAAPFDPTFFFGSRSGTDGATQYSNANAFAVSFVNQDGIRFGYRTGVDIDGDGIVRAVFDNGQRLAVARIPLVTFSDPNRLQNRTGNLYAETDDSGSAVANYDKVGGAGTINPASLEASTVDLSDQFTRLIVTQRSYSANARVITTADELLQELVNIKR